MRYFPKEIEDLSWVQEALIEKFDQSIINIMTENSFVYGGSIRDVVAGMPLHGDLDIVVPSGEAVEVINALSRCPKWSKYGGEPPKPKANRYAHRYVFSGRSLTPAPSRRVEEIPVPPQRAVAVEAETETESREVTEDAEGPSIEPSLTSPSEENREAREPSNRVWMTEKPNGYRKSLGVKIVTTYESLDGRKAQIIVAEAKTGPLDEDGKRNAAINLIRNVDIVCCGLAMNKKGQIFEIIEGAHGDCKNKILRFNKATIDSVHIDSLKKRIEKFEKRGWISKIDIEKIEKRHKRILEIRQRREEKRKARREEEAKKRKATAKKSKKEPSLEDLSKWSKKARLLGELYGQADESRPRKKKNLFAEMTWDIINS